MLIVKSWKLYQVTKIFYFSNEVLTTLTTDVSKIMSKLLAVTPQGELKLMSGLRVAHLALKHRQVFIHASMYFLKLTFN